MAGAIPKHLDVLKFSMYGDFSTTNSIAVEVMFRESLISNSFILPQFSFKTVDNLIRLNSAYFSHDFCAK